MAALLVLVGLTTACSVEKRHYTSGYHLTWNHKSGKAKDIPAKPAEQVNQLAGVDEQLTASSENGIKDWTGSVVKRPVIFDSIPQKLNCDSVFFRTGGDKVACKVFEINANEIKYKKCSNPDGPLFVVKRSDVYKIRYTNGTEEIIAAPDPVKTVEKKGKKDKAPIKDPKEIKEKYPEKPVFLYTALISLLAGITALLFLSAGTGGAFLLFFLFAAAAFAFGLMSLIKMKRNPGKYKGKGMAITGMIFGGVELLILLFALLIVLLVGI